ncbi:hypothetical protein DYY67_0564 [Candidatus Nitrosotalea sp. TS]|nr:hypothetical protein [Candidatus Nitrosotalea sp. TS]
MVKTIDIIYYNFKQKRNKMKGLLFLALLVSIALLIHTAYAEGMGVAAKPGKNNLESYTDPVFLGIFSYESSGPIVNSPSISSSNLVTQAPTIVPIIPNVVPVIPNATLIAQNVTSDENATADWLAQFSPFTPQNAYSTFVSQLNQTVQAIFWGQFNYTEQKTNEGLAAMNQVKQNGGSAEQAREAFIQNASTSRSDITTVNNNLNVQYGHANSTVQQEFDQWGNLR